MASGDFVITQCHCGCLHNEGEPAVTEALLFIRDIHEPTEVRPVDDDGVQWPPVKVCMACGRGDVRWPCYTRRKVDEALAVTAAPQPASPGEPSESTE